jgi:hypothetical protein
MIMFRNSDSGGKLKYKINVTKLFCGFREGNENSDEIR